MAADRRRRTPWFPRSISPVHRGTYECAAQITNAGPAFLWELEWDGKGFLVPIPMIVKRWRGLVKRTAGVPEVHARLAQAKKLHGLGPFVDAVLAECPDAECPTCAEIVCVQHDRFHFHHDGCPSCEQSTPGVQGTSPEQQR